MKRFFRNIHDLVVDVLKVTCEHNLDKRVCFFLSGFSTHWRTI